MLNKILSIAACLCFVFALTATPLAFNAKTFSIEKNVAFAKKDKEKSEKKVKKEKSCSRDVNCNDENKNRKDGEKSKKGGQSEKMKGKGKKE